MSLLLLFNQGTGGAIVGSASGSLGSFGGSASGNIGVQGSASGSLGTFGGSATGIIAIMGSASGSLGTFGGSATGVIGELQPEFVFVGRPAPRKLPPILGFVAAQLGGIFLEATGAISTPAPASVPAQILVLAPNPGQCSAAIPGVSIACQGELTWPDDEVDALALLLALAA